MVTELKHIREFFHLEKNKYICLVPDCKSQIATLRDSALIRHFDQCHQSKLREVENPGKKTQNLEELRNETLNICVEHVTVNGRTLNSINDSAFKKLLKSRLDVLRKTQFNLTMQEINLKLRPMIHDIAVQIRTMIREEFKGKHFSIMFDTVTKRNRAILGIDIRTINDGKIISRSIGMERIKCTHAGANIAKMIADRLQLYGIPMEKMVTSTVDNARNMVKAVKVMDDMMNEILIDESDEEESSDENNIESHWIDPEFQKHLMEQTNNELCSNFKPYLYESIDCMRCACHTIHLAVDDSIKITNCVSTIDKSRDLVKNLRLQQILLKLEEKCLPIPLLDCITRWFSTYTMVRFHSFLFYYIYASFTQQFEYVFFSVVWGYQMQTVHYRLYRKQFQTKNYQCTDG